MIVYYQSHAWDVNDLAREHGIKPNVLRRRIQRGWYVDLALKKPSKQKQRTVEYNGVMYSSIKELCQKMHFSEKLFRYRLYMGWDIDRILNTPKRHYVN
jgi:hypothetical protein